MEKLIEFLKSQKLMAIPSHNQLDVWIANVYIGVDDNGTIYFISAENTKHSKMILKSPIVAFSSAWFDPNNHRNRKAIQGLGICRLAENESEIATGVTLHNQSFPEFKEEITLDWIHHNEWDSRVWVLKPSFINHWDDELYGDDESAEFSFS